MNTLEILGLETGAPLNEAIHTVIYGKPITADAAALPAYSTDDALALALLETLPLFVARIDPPLSKERPFTAGQLAHSESGQMDHTVLRVMAPTMAVALCKAALLVALKQAAAKANAPVVESAASIVARAGRLARNRAAKLPAKAKPSRTGYKGKKALRIAAECETKKAARLESMAKIGRPLDKTPTGPTQPRAFLRHRSDLAPIPKRRDIVIPT